MSVTQRVSARALARVIREATASRSADEIVTEMRKHLVAVKELAAQLNEAPDLDEFLEDYSEMGFDDGEDMLAPVASEMITLVREIWFAMDRDLSEDSVNLD